ncbi:MAG: glycosyltransferase family 2 protein [Opitutales bacterium]
MDATVVITTKDRAPELRGALTSVFAQDVALEVIVVDDGSSDDTTPMVRKEFPQVRVIRHETSAGLVESRNEAARAASAPFIFSIDDDAVYTDPGTIRKALAYFEDPRVAALALPYVNVKVGPEVLTGCPDDGVEYVAFTFVGTAHAHRRSVFLELEGYRGSLRHWGEERDYCIRLYDAGYLVAMACTSPIDHFISDKRDLSLSLRLLYRNQILFPLTNAPFPAAFKHLARAFLWNCKEVFNRPGYVGAWFRAHGELLWGLPGFLKLRAPVRSKTFSLAMRLHRAGPTPKDTIARELPEPKDLKAGISATSH